MTILRLAAIDFEFARAPLILYLAREVETARQERIAREKLHIERIHIAANLLLGGAVTGARLATHTEKHTHTHNSHRDAEEAQNDRAYC